MGGMFHQTFQSAVDSVRREQARPPERSTNVWPTQKSKDDEKKLLDSRNARLRDTLDGLAKAVPQIPRFEEDVEKLLNNAFSKERVEKMAEAHKNKKPTNAEL